MKSHSSSTALSSDHAAFIIGGGEMGERIRTFDWSSTSLGPISDWPSPLKIAVNMALHSPLPVSLHWGCEGVLIYNDLYREIAGGKHPAILGKKLLDASSYKNQHLELYRNGLSEEVWLDLYYTPVMDDKGQPVGVLATVIETTQRVLAERARQKSEERLSLALEATRDGLWDWDFIHDKAWWDERYGEIMGIHIAESERAFASVTPYIHPEDREIVYKALKAHLEQGKEYSCEFRMQPPSGEIRHILSRGKAVLNEQGQLARLAGTVTDITKRKRTEEALKESEERFRTMAEGSDILIALGDETGSATYFNQAWVALTGRPMENLLDYGWADLIHPNDRQNFVNIFLHAFEEKKPFAGEFRIMSNSGEYRWLLAKGPPRFRPDGSFAGYISSCVDITERKQAEEEKQQLVALIEASDEFIGLATLEGKSLYVNPAGLKLLGWKNLDGKFIQDCVYAEDWNLAQTLLAKLLTEGSFQHEIRLSNVCTAEPFWVLWNGITLKDPHTGEITALATVSSNITELKRSEQALKESEARFRFIADAVPMFIFMAGEDAQVTFWNKTWLEFTGQTNEEALKNAWVNVIHPDDYEATVAVYMKAFNTRQSFDAIIQPYENRYKNKDGEYRWVLWKGLPRYFPNGDYAGLIGAGVDITERKQAEEAVKAYGWQQKAIVDFGLHASSGVDNVLGITKIAVKMVAETLGIGFSKIIQRVPGTENDLHFLAVYGFDQTLIGQVFHPGSEPHAAHTLVALEPIVTDDIYQETRFNASPFHYEHGLISGACVIIYADNQPFGVLEVDSKEKRHFTDIEVSFLQTTATLIGTVIERKHNEEALAHQNNRIKDYAQRLESSNKDLSQFASLASHDLQAPLRKVMMFSDIIYQQETERLSKEGRSYIQRMQASVLQMQTLISDLLTLSKVDQTSKKAFQAVSLTRIIERVKDDLYVNIEETEAIVTLGSSCVFEADEQQMVQLMANLIGNGIKYRREDVRPEIQIQCEVLNEFYIKLLVSDNGIGIESEHFDRIFEIFQRLHNESRYSGTGIGLAIVKRIVGRHHGKIAVESVMGQGTTFLITLPIRQAWS